MRRLKAAPWIALLMLMLSGWMYLTGYRITPWVALQAAFPVDDPHLMTTVEKEWGNVYVLRTAEGYITVACYRSSHYLWRCPLGTLITANTTDDVSTTGWLSWNDTGRQVTVLSVTTTNPAVAFIEAGPTTKRTRYRISVDDPVLLTWDKAFSLKQLTPTALAQDGSVLYEYRTPNGVARIPDNLKWYSVMKGSQTSQDL